MEVLEFRFAFFARDFQKSVRFYRETLGLRLVGSWDRPDGKGARLSAGGTAVVEIYGVAGEKPYDGPRPTAIHLALRLKDMRAVNAVYERLSTAGVDRVEPLQDRKWGHRTFIVYDPDDIPVHVYCEIW